MAKSKQQSATQRREQTRQNRSTVQSPASNTNKQTKRNRRSRQAQRNSTWLFVGGILVLVIVVVGLFIFLSNQPGTSTTSNGAVNSSVDAATLKTVTQVDPSVLDQVSTGGVSNPFKLAAGATASSGSVNAATPLTGPNGKPEVFYYGAEWCPNCAAERWSVVVALSRFGTFSGLKTMASSSSDTYPNTATFTFSQSTYTSSYIDGVLVEHEDLQHNVLHAPTASEQQVLTQNNFSGYPFMDIGNKFLITGASYDPGLLRVNVSDPTSQPLSMQTIASQLTSENQLSKSILGTANYLTASICAITNNQPSTVCGDPVIQGIETNIAQTTQAYVAPNGSSVTAIAANLTMDVRRQQHLA